MPRPLWSERQQTWHSSGPATWVAPERRSRREPGKGALLRLRARGARPDHPARRGRDRRRRHRDLGVQPGPPGHPGARQGRRRGHRLGRTAHGRRPPVLRARRRRRPVRGPRPLRRPGPVGCGPGATGPLHRTGPGHRDRARRVQLHRDRGRHRPGADHPRGGPVGHLDPARRGQDPDAAGGAGRRVRRARHHHGPVPVGRPVQPASGRIAGRRLPAGYPVRGRLPGQLARRTDRDLPTAGPGRHREVPQAVEAHAGPGRAGPGRGRDPVPPVPPRPLPRFPPGRGRGPPRTPRPRPGPGPHVTTPSPGRPTVLGQSAPAPPEQPVSGLPAAATAGLPAAATAGLPAAATAGVTVIGCDGGPLPPAATAALAAAAAVAGAPRHLAAAPVPPEAERIPIRRLDPALDAIGAHPGPVAVLASGDPGFFGIVRALRARGLTPAVIPAVSSVALAFARLGLDWDDALILSAHGRETGPAAAAALAHPKAAILTGPPEAATGTLRNTLRQAGRTIYVAERLGTPDERVRDLTGDPAAEVTDPHVLISLAPEPTASPSDPGSPAAPRWLAGHPGAPASWALAETGFDHRD